MNPSKFDKLESIYEGIFDLPPSEHQSYLDKHCEGDSEIRNEIESLLKFDHPGNEFIDSSPSTLAAEVISANDNLIGKTIGRYEVISLLGKGGMGEVYLAKDTELGRQVAMKFLSDEVSKDASKSSRFIKEAKAASALNHPNIITVHEINEFEGRQYIAMEYIDGITLGEFRKKNTPDVHDSLEISMQVASALHEAHSAGIIHRDIKSENIMVRPNGLVKVLDFGIAKLVSDIDSDAVREATQSSMANGNRADTDPTKTARKTPVSFQSQTSPGLLIGTANYMSPEQAKGEEVTPQSDIFSFGILLYELLSGVLPFAGKSPLETIGAILFKEPDALKSFGVPENVERVVFKCLEKDGDDRYHSAQELLGDLERANRHQKNAGENKNRNAVPRSVSSYLRPWLVAPLVLLLTFAVGFSFFQYSSSRPEIDSVAVMPFVNESGNQDAEYLSDGMTESLIRSLSNVPGLSVKARNTVYHYKGQQVSAKKVSEELDVQAVLVGRIVKNGDQLRLNLELIDASGDDVLWSNQYDQIQKNLIELQNQVAIDVFDELQNTRTEKSKELISKTSTQNSDAYKNYLQGRYHWNLRTTSGHRQAIVYFQKAIDQDPKFALAYVGLADSVAFLNFTPETDFEKARALVLKAIELDPTLGEAHTTLGLVIHEAEQDWKEAERQFQTAIDLNPNYATTHQWYAELLVQMGNIPKALYHFEKAAEIDPFSMPILTDRGFAYFTAGQPDKAIRILNGTIKKDPTFYRSYTYLAIIFEHQGKLEKAVEMYSKGFLAREKDEKTVEEYSITLRDALKQSGEEGYWKKRLELYNKYPELRTGDSELVNLYLKTKQEDKAFAEIERQIKSLTFGIFNLRTAPEFKHILDRQEIKDILKRTNFPKAEN